MPWNGNELDMRQAYGTHEARSTMGVAALSARRGWLGPRLRHARIGARFLLAQSEEPGTILPVMRSPCLLDTGGLSPRQLMPLLSGLARAPIATLALVDPADLVAQRLLALCPAVYALASDSDSLSNLLPWLQHMGAVGSERLLTLAPLRIGLSPLPPPHLTDADLLGILMSLMAATTMREAAERSGCAPRTFFRKLAQVRAALGLPMGALTRYDPRALADSLLQAFGAMSPASTAEGAPAGQRRDAAAENQIVEGDPVPFQGTSGRPEAATATAPHELRRAIAEISQGLRIGIATVAMHDEWEALVRAVSESALLHPPDDAAPDLALSAWLVVLDAQHPPARYQDCMRTLRAPILLITPQTWAAQELCVQIKKLALICHPLRVRSVHDLRDFLTMAAAARGGTLVLAAPRPDMRRIVTRGTIRLA
jgi:hypothetical protein